MPNKIWNTKEPSRTTLGHSRVSARARTRHFTPPHRPPGAGPWPVARARVRELGPRSAACSVVRPHLASSRPGCSSRGAPRSPLPSPLDARPAAVLERLLDSRAFWLVVAERAARHRPRSVGWLQLQSQVRQRRQRPQWLQWLQWWQRRQCQQWRRRPLRRQWRQRLQRLQRWPKRWQRRRRRHALSQGASHAGGPSDHARAAAYR